jgi:hypothetical protein
MTVTYDEESEILIVKIVPGLAQDSTQRILVSIFETNFCESF